MAIVDHTGVRGESLADHRADLERRFREEFGTDFDLAPETPQGQIIGIVAQVLVEHDEQVVAQGNALSVDHAVGTQLDDLGSLLGIERDMAVRSRVTATLFGMPATLVPAGSRARTATGEQFETTTDAVLSSSGVSVEMIAVQAGAIQAAANTLTEIVTLVPGWEQVTNPSPAAVGRPLEADTGFRSRYRSRTARPATGPTDALRAAIVEAGATRLRVEENATSVAVVRQGLSLAPHSITCIVEGGTDASVEDAISRAKGTGVAINVSIVGGEPNLTMLAQTAVGSIEYNGQVYSGGATSSGMTPTQQVAYLNDALPDDITLGFYGGRFVAHYEWTPDARAEFAGGVAGLMGLQRAQASYPPGPFQRPVSRPLVVLGAVTIDRDVFPANGLALMRQGLIDRVAAYEIGATPWANDLLCVVEAVPGTQVSAWSVTDGGAAINTATPLLSNHYALADTDLTLTLTES